MIGVSKLVTLLFSVILPLAVRLGVNSEESGSCSIYSSCKNRPDVMPSRCSCDANCTTFGDCCLDSPHYELSKQFHNAQQYDCVSISEYFGIYVKSGCVDGWQKTKISALCAEASPSKIYNQSDPLLSFPVTDEITSVTYANYYCAVCNNNTENLIPWEGKMKCQIRDEDWENVLDFFQWELYDPEYKNVLLSNDSITRYLGFNREAVYKRMSNNSRVQNYIESNLLFSQDDDSWVVYIEHSSKHMKLTCGVSLIESDKSRDCGNIVDSCPVGYKSKLNYFLCKIYIDQVIDRYDKVIYKNRHCAICNNKPAERLDCYHGTLAYIPHLLAVLLSVPEAPGKYEYSHSYCRKNKTYISSYNSCQSTLCLLSSEIHRNGICLDDEILPPFQNDSYISDKMMEKDNRKSIKKLSENSGYRKNSSFCNENWLFVAEKDFLTHKNNTIFLGSKGMEEKLIDFKKVEGGYIVCLKHAEISKILNWVSFVCLIVSILCLSLHVLVFILLDTFRNLAGKNLVSFSTCLLIAFIVFLVSPSVSPDTANCYATACVMYFSFFASFCWMNIIAFDTWDSFRTGMAQLYLRRGDQNKRFLVYSLYSWSLATVAVIFLVVTDQSEPEGLPSYLYPSLGHRRCWFGHNTSLLMFFVLPVFVFIILNIVFFVSTSWNIMKNKSLPEGIQSSIDTQLLKVYVRLAVLKSIAWVTGIIAYFVDTDVAWFFFTILISLQGAFIFAAFTCNKKVWSGVLGVLGYSSEPPQTTPVKTISHDEEGNQQPYQTPRIELLHVSSFIDAVHQPSRLS